MFTHSIHKVDCLCFCPALQCRVGDVVRATTAFTMQMTFPTAQLLFGGKQHKLGGARGLMCMFVCFGNKHAALILLLLC